MRGPITSPTFVIARVHPSLVGGPALVHVDAYRLGSAVELDDLDLDADLDASVVVVEWGAGLAEQLSDSRLELTISGDAERTVHAVAVGARFEHVLAELVAFGSLTDVLLLAIDTSTTAITTALHDGSSVVAEVTTLDARAHAEHLAPGLRAALAEAGAAPTDVTDVAVGIGPGPFTGLRVGIVTARAFAFALGLPVRGLTSLDAIAHEAWLSGRRGDLLVATDARRKEVYAATYVLDEAAATRVAGPLVSRAADLEADVEGCPRPDAGRCSTPTACPSPSSLSTSAPGRLRTWPCAGSRWHPLSRTAYGSRWSPAWASTGSSRSTSGGPTSRPRRRARSRRWGERRDAA